MTLDLDPDLIRHYLIEYVIPCIAGAVVYLVMEVRRRTGMKRQTYPVQCSCLNCDSSPVVRIPRGQWAPGVNSGEGDGHDEKDNRFTLWECPICGVNACSKTNGLKRD